MTQALEQDPENADVLANAIVMNTVNGKLKEAQALMERLEKVTPDHELIRGLTEKRDLFESAKAKYNPVFEIK